MVSAEELRPCGLFKGLDDQELEQIAAIAHHETYAAGERICACSSYARGAFRCMSTYDHPRSPMER
jgi:hypothetical protein